jgi:hypothetical protein
MDVRHMVNLNRIFLKCIILFLSALLFAFIFLLSGCNTDTSTSQSISSNAESTTSVESKVTTPTDSPLAPYGSEPMVMIRIDGNYYSCTEVPVSVPQESQIIGRITSAVPDDSEEWWCTKDNQVSSGFSEFLNAPYAMVNGEIIILHGEEWHRLCKGNWTEPTTTD